MKNDESGFSIVELLIVLVFIGAFAFIGSYILKRSKAATPPLKPQLAGVIDRHGIPNESSYLSKNGGPIAGIVIQANWSSIQPNSNSDFNTSSIDQQLSYAKSVGLAVKLRVYAGRNSPKWLIQSVGKVHLVSVNGQNNIDEADVPRFWKPAAITAYTNLQSKLAAKYDSDPSVLEVSDSGCATFYGEPFIRNMNDAATGANGVKYNNLQTYKNAGYTDAASQNCLNATLTAHAAWQQTRTGFDIDPLQLLSSSGGSSTTFPDKFMSSCRSQLGGRCVLGNNGLSDKAVGSSVSHIIGTIKSLGKPIYFQTKQPGLYNYMDSLLQTGISNGAGMIELPNDYTSAPTSNKVPTTPAFYAPYQTSLKNQAAL
jgi:hypothetical protein